jgi:hypothetical protein
MSSLDSTFEELARQFKNPGALNPAKSDPLFFLVHAPDDTLELKRKIPLWAAKFREDGKEVEILSFAALLWEILDGSNRWDEWLKMEPEHELGEINEAVRSVLATENALVGPNGCGSGVNKTFRSPSPMALPRGTNWPASRRRRNRRTSNCPAKTTKMRKETKTSDPQRPDDALERT